MARDVSGPEDMASAWLMRFAEAIAPGARVLEIACGNGRNTRFLAARGFAVTAVDLHLPEQRLAGVDYIEADLENGLWPFGEREFDAVVGINYLWRERFHLLGGALKQNGLFLYETFNEEQAAYMGRPRNPEHFLKTGELLCLIPPTWRILAYEDGLTGRGQYLQRIAARKCIFKNMMSDREIGICTAR